MTFFITPFHYTDCFSVRQIGYGGRGFVGSFDEAIKDIAEYLPDECKGMTEKLAEVSDPASMVKTLLKHARIQVEQAAKDMERKPREQVLGVEL